MKKQQKKRNKKYQGGFSERLQKRSGGRIKAVVGGPQELKNITNYTPMLTQMI